MCANQQLQNIQSTTSYALHVEHKLKGATAVWYQSCMCCAWKFHIKAAAGAEAQTLCEVVSINRESQSVGLPATPCGFLQLLTVRRTSPLSSALEFAVSRQFRPRASTCVNQLVRIKLANFTREFDVRRRRQNRTCELNVGRSQKSKC